MSMTHPTEQYNHNISLNEDTALHIEEMCNKYTDAEIGRMIEERSIPELEAAAYMVRCDTRRSWYHKCHDVRQAYIITIADLVGMFTGWKYFHSYVIRDMVLSNSEVAIAKAIEILKMAISTHLFSCRCYGFFERHSISYEVHEGSTISIQTLSGFVTIDALGQKAVMHLGETLSAYGCSITPSMAEWKMVMFLLFVS